MKNNKKKKMLVIALLLFAVIGLTGYGVYSYYYTQGTYEGVGSSIEVAAFDPRTTLLDYYAENSSEDFLGEGGYVMLSCPDSVTGNENLTCTGSVLISNNGDTDITIDVEDAYSGTGNSESSGEFNLNVSNPSFDSTHFTLEAGGSRTLGITVPVTVDSYFGDSSGYDAGESARIFSEGIQVTVNFSLKATQVHN